MIRELLKDALGAVLIFALGYALLFVPLLFADPPEEPAGYYDEMD